MPTNLSVQWKILAPVIAIFPIGVAFVALYVPYVVEQNVKRETVSVATQTIGQVKALRHYYTEHVIEKALAGQVMVPTDAHADRADAIPLPTTMVLELSDRFSSSGTRISLYSPYPFPHRKRPPLGPYERTAWQHLEVNPGDIYVEDEVAPDGRYVRVATADRMDDDTCVNCHNMHPNSPMRGWRLGDVRGVLEVRRRVEEALAQGEATARGIVLVLLGVLLALVVAVFVSVRYFVSSRIGVVHASMQRVVDGELESTSTELEPLAGVRDEVGGLASGFLEMSSRLRDQHARLNDEHRKELERLAYFDSLTGLPNRTQFRRNLEQAVGLARRHGHRMVLMFIDLDGFKAVNDALGHDAGDIVLTTFAGRLKECLRATDTLGHSTSALDELDGELDHEELLAARLGGDEFTVILNRIDALKDIDGVSHRILGSLAQPMKIKGHEVMCTSSVGIAVCPDDGAHTDALLRAADVAMYQAKRSGKNQSRRYAPEMDAE